MLRILKGSTFTWSLPVVLADDGETAADASGTPTVTVTRDDGTVLAAPTVTHVSNFLGQYTAAITTTHTSQCDRLTVTSSATTATGAVQAYTDVLEVVGGHYVTIPQIRAEPGMSSVDTFPTALLTDLRDEFEDMCEEIVGYSFVRRYQRDRLESRLRNGGNLDGVYGPDPLEIVLTKPYPETLLALSINGTAQTLTDFTLYPWGKVRYNKQGFLPVDPTNGGRNIIVAYEHGRLAPPPPLRRECLDWIRFTAKARNSQMSKGASRQQQSGGTSVDFTPTGKGPTGTPSLDSLLYRLRLDMPGIG